MTEKITELTVCKLKGHDWRAHGPMYSDGWKSKCARCGKIKSVDR